MDTSKWFRWFTDGMPIRLPRMGWRGHDAGSAVGDRAASFEHVDGAMLDASDFRASDAMRLDPLAHPDFAETLPAFVTSQPAMPRRALRRAGVAGPR